MDILIVVLIAGVLGLAVWYIVRAKKKGVKCIGCPDGSKCSGSCTGCSCSCGK